MMIFGVEVKGDHTFDRDSVERYIEQAYKAGRLDERAKIVAWLREQNPTSVLELEDDLAEAIEAGWHLK